MTARPMTADTRPIRRALLSVYYKTGLDELVTALHAAGAEIVSTGTTAAFVEGMGVPVTRVEQLTGFPESLDGRVKTLHPKVHAGLLADLRLDSHRAQLAELGIEPFDLLVSNLYPFAETVAGGGTEEEIVEKIDIGGPAMVRSAAKNHASVAVVTDPARYPEIIAAITAGGTTLAQRRSLAAQAFADIATYDLAIAQWCLANLTSRDEVWPTTAAVVAQRAAVLRYGENPHQQAALYLDASRPAGLAQAIQVAGKEMSYNNYVDADAAWRACHDFTETCVAIIKHANPCGIAIGDTVVQAHAKAHACDPMSAYGGVIAVNSEVDIDLVDAIKGKNPEVLVAPGYTPAARQVLATRKNLRVLLAPHWQPEPTEVRLISGGLLVQTVDRVDATGDDTADWTLVSGEPVDARHPGRSPVCLAGDPLSEVKCDPAGQRRRLGRRGDGSGQPGRRQSAGGGTGRRAGQGRGGRERRVLPVRRRAADPAGRGNHRHCGARWVDPGRGGHRGGTGGRGDALPHRYPALLPLSRPRVLEERDPAAAEQPDVVAERTFVGDDWGGLEFGRQTWERCEFRQVDLTEAVLTGCVFRDCEFTGVRFNSATLTRCALLHCVIRRCSLFDATLAECKLTGTALVECVLRPVHIQGGDWSYVALRGQDLSGLDLSGLRLREADLTEADLRGTDLRRAELGYAKLHNAKLRGADLRGANLEAVPLKGLDLTDVRIDLGQAMLFAAAHGARVEA